MAEPIGIDLGTTYSLAATVSEAGVRIHQTEMGQRSTPSVVLIDSTGTVVGEEAKHSAAVYPERTFGFFKRDMGVPGTERTVDGKLWTPEQLSAEVLRSLAGDVHRDTGEQPTQAVITVPAYFGEGARRATVEAGKLAGLEVLELIHEPTAAALAFGFGSVGEVQTRTILVYDLGGGTFDVSLVRLGGEEMVVLATDGDHELGGKDWDDVVIEIVADRFNERHGLDPRWDPVAAADLRTRCEDAKRSLSRVPSTTVAVVSDGANDRIPVSREEFGALSAGLLAQTETLVNAVLSDGGFRWDQIDAAVLVGGSTRMPACAALIERLSGRAPTRGIDPDLAVAQGAALVAAHHRPEAGQRDASRSLRAVTRSPRGGPDAPDRAHSANGLARSVAVKDVTAHALGFVVINAAGDRYVNDVMITRNTALPARQTKTKRLEKGIDELDVYVLQGHQERPLATESLGRYRFANVPGGKKDRDVDVSFAYDSDGMVQVSAMAGGNALSPPLHDPGDRDLSWTDEDPRDHARSMLDVALVMDCSGSMSGQPLAEAKQACVDFAGLIGELAGARVALVSFANGARIEAPLTEDSSEVTRSARGLTTYGGTDLTAGLKTAAAAFDREQGRRVLVVATDGEPNDTVSALAAARDCQALGLEIVTIGVTGANMSFLRSISTADRDSIFTNDMRGALRSIARSLAGGVARRT